MTIRPILYSFRRCPYAMRARMALWVSGVTVELREVVLKDKPQELRQLSPKATVPVLDLPGHSCLDESLAIMEWALTQADPEGWLLPAAAERDATAALIADNDGFFKSQLDRYKYPGRFAGADAASARSAGCAFLATLARRLAGQPYLFGAQRSLADIAIVPFVRQFAGVEPAWWQQEASPVLRSWLQRLIDTELFRSVMPAYPQWQAGAPAVLFGPANTAPAGPP